MAKTRDTPAPAGGEIDAGGTEWAPSPWPWQICVWSVALLALWSILHPPPEAVAGRADVPVATAPPTDPACRTVTLARGATVFHRPRPAC